MGDGIAYAVEKVVENVGIKTQRTEHMRWWITARNMENKKPQMVALGVHVISVELTTQMTNTRTLYTVTQQLSCTLY